MTNDRKYRDIYVIGDIHGDWDGYRSVWWQMIDDGMNTYQGDLLVFLGDMVDGFDYSREVVSDIKAMQADNPEGIVVLKGNHDELMIHGVDAPVDSDQFQVWWMQGGRQTWESYWDEDRTVEADTFMTRPYINVAPKMHEHVEWFKTLPTMFETEDYIFVHAGVDPEQDDPRDTSHFARLWIRGPFLRSERMWDKTIVHGHSPVKEPEVKPNRINVNTRPRNTGKVTGARLSNDGSRKVERFFHGPVSTRM